MIPLTPALARGASVVPIVEGQGEVEAVPILLRRVLHSQTAHSVEVRRPIRVKRNQVVKPGELERAIELASMQPNCRAILILLDADDDCPAVLGPKLLLRAQAARPDVPCSVVLAKSEFEAWFVGSIESLRGHCGIREEAVAPAAPEDIRGAKGWLTRQMSAGRTYLETDDQPSLASRFDIQQARQRCDSFDKFMRDVDALLVLMSSNKEPI